jgi:DNA-directed RNA polymerase subunit M/transcription elongation factor TFIIS
MKFNSKKEEILKEIERVSKSIYENSNLPNLPIILSPTFFKRMKRNGLDNTSKYTKETLKILCPKCHTEVHLFLMIDHCDETTSWECETCSYKFRQ